MEHFFKYLSLILIISLFITNSLSADESEIDDLLNMISIKDDLSQKTKLENAGISYIYTREDIQKMQAHSLKDILKSVYPASYRENSYGLSDPFMMSAHIPFMSGGMRVYIDDQEITPGLYGSGMIIYGDMDINFIDHIEIYMGNPTFEFSIEPAFIIIKLYSKNAQRDGGNKVSFSAGSYGARSGYGYNAMELDSGWSYFAYISSVNDKRKKYDNKDATISRDKKTTHFFSSLQDNNNKILVDVIAQKRDAFISQSLFASPNRSEIDTQYIHVGYNGSSDNLSYSLVFDSHNAQSYFNDKNENTIKAINVALGQNLPYMIYQDFDSQSYTASLKYKIKTTSNDFLVGLNYRYKHFIFKDVLYNDTELPKDEHTNQTTATLFLENQYSLSSNQIITLGGTYASVTNNHSSQDDDLFSFRSGYTYTDKNLVSKTTFAHIEVSLDPYLVNSLTFLAYPDEKVPKAEYNVFIQNVKYKKDSNLYEFINICNIVRHALVPNENGQLEAYSRNLLQEEVLLRYIREYNTFDKLELDVGMNYVDKLPNGINLVKGYFATIRNFNTYKKFDIFNEILFNRDTLMNENFYDYSAGVIWHKSDDLSISVKGTNIFNRAREERYATLSLTTLKSEDKPLSVSPIDKSFMITVEYTF